VVVTELELKVVLQDLLEMVDQVEVELQMVLLLLLEQELQVKVLLEAQQQAQPKLVVLEAVEQVL
jgi:hypothetical protein